MAKDMDTGSAGSAGSAGGAGVAAGAASAEAAVSLSMQEILEYIPHRYPMLLVDRVERLIPHKSVHAVKGVSMNEDFFQGHFPGHPIMPGVLIVEALAQAATVLTSYSIGGVGSGTLAYFMSIEAAKFRKPVVPGSLLDLHVDIEQLRGKVARFSGRAEVSGAVHTEARFTAMLAAPPQK